MHGPIQQALIVKFKTADESVRMKYSNEFIHEFVRTVRIANFTPLTQEEIDFADTPEEVPLPPPSFDILTFYDSLSLVPQ